VRRGSRSGLECIVAIHSTVLGPALGGVRIWSYPETADAARDALRLAGAMTLKAAAAELGLGGGKGVVCAPREGLTAELRRAALLDFGDLVESFEGRYVTAEDVGTSPDDLVTIATRTAHLTGLPPERGGSGDPSPFTALGVEAAMRACARERFGDRSLAGRRVAVVGLGRVGGNLVRRLADAGCELVVSDLDCGKRPAAEALGAIWVDPAVAVATECDVLAPCALGGAIEAANADSLRCSIVCGSANNQLTDESLARELDRSGILYAPDFIANAGGLINVYREIKGYDEARARQLAIGIEQTMARIFDAARSRDCTPLDAARALAQARLESAAAVRATVR
jgi:leucine dehydrogenase